MRFPKIITLISLVSLPISSSMATYSASDIVEVSEEDGPTGDEEEELTGVETCLNPPITTPPRPPIPEPPYEEEPPYDDDPPYIWPPYEEDPYPTCSIEESLSGGASVIMNGGMRYFTWSHDYVSRTDASGCSPCGGANSANGGAGLPELAITRYFEPISYAKDHLTFGALMGLKKFDQRLTFTPGHVAVVLDDYGSLNSKRALEFDPVQLCWTEKAVRHGQGIASLHLFDSASLPVTTAATRDNAHTAVRLNFDGSSVHFEVLWDASGEGVARPVAFLDRHGNAIEIEYVDAHPAFGTPATENFRPYFRKTLMRDAHGREANFTYEKLWHRYVATRIDLPNGGHITYDYIWNGGVILEKVTHADGEESLWSIVNNSTTKLTEYTLLDAKSDAGHRRKRVYLTQSQSHAPGGGTMSTVKSRVRRVQNGAGEFVWDSRFSSDLAERFIYEGGNSVRKLTFPQSGRGLGKVEHITNDLWIGNFHAGDVSTWQTETRLAERLNDTAHFPVSNKDTRNRTKSVTSDVISHVILDNQYADGTTTSTPRNQFTQPTVTVDRLGRVTTRTYSALGDLLTVTRATGTSDEATCSFVYNTRGQVIEARDHLYDVNYPELHNTRYEYDANGYLIKKIAAADVASGTRPETLYTYDSAGRLATTTDPVGRVTQFFYDLENRHIETLYADSSTELVEYGTGLEANLVVKTTDRNGFETTYAYDAADRVIETVTAANTSDPSVETCTYLPGTRLKQTCTRDGETTTYLFDERNRVIGTETRPDANTTLTRNTELDELNRTRSTTDAYGRKTFYLYDQNDRVTRTVTETVPGALAAPAITVGATQSSSQENYTLTALDTTTLETDPNSEGRTHEVTYTDPRDLYLAGLTRDLTANAAYLITDTIYDAEGQALIRTDARGNHTWMEYDERGRNTLTIHAVGTAKEIRSETLYDDNSNTIEVRHPRYFAENIEARDLFTYNGRNLRATHTTAPGTTITATQSWTYYPDGRANEHTDFRNNTAKKIWHTCCGRLQASIDRDGQSTTIYNTDRKGQPIHTAVVSQNPGGDWTDPVDADTLQETTTRFDGRGRPTYTTVWLQPLGDIGTCCGGTGTDPIPIAGLDSVPATDGLTTTFAYDDDLTDGIGIDATYAAKLAQLAASGTVFGPGSTGSAVAVTNPEGETTVRISDGIGRTVMSIDAEGNTSIMDYDQTVEPATFAIIPAATPIPGTLLSTSMTDPNGNTSTSYSDGAGRTLASEDAAGNVAFSGHDANGNRVATRDPNGLGEDCDYDALNRDIYCADLQEQSEITGRSKTYNAASQPVTSTDAEGKVTTMEYDVRNRLVSTTDPNNIEVSYVYDKNNNLTELTDGEGHTRTWSYNSRNLVIEKQYPGNSADNLEYFYDALRRLSVKVDQLDDTVYHVYDLAGRLIEKEYRTGGSVVESTDTFTYDAASRLLTSSKGRYGVTTAHTWNADGTPASESFTADGRTYTSARSYDDGNRPLTHTYPDGNATTWAYDTRNLVTGVSYEGNAIVSQTHDDGNRLTNQTLGNGLTRTIAYGRADNMRTADTTFDGATALGDLDFAYSYAIDKQVTAETIDSDLVPDASFTASYDDGNRVTGWDRPGAPGTIRNTQSWNYDDAGNWDSTTIDGTAENRSHTTADQISLLAGNVVTNDLKGNLTAFTHDKPTLIGPVETDYLLEWDQDNRLKKATVENDDVEYRYDALGRRVIRKEGTTETALIWWGDSENAEYEHSAGQPCIQNDIFAHPSTLNSVIARAIDGDENDLEWYHKNYLDHVYAISDDTGGDLIEHYRYSAFGEIEIFDELGVRIAATQINNSITWNTRRLDSLTGFYLYKYRHYSPQLGRWPSRDPIREAGGYNLYGFVGNDGVSSWDFLGMEDESSSTSECNKKAKEIVASDPMILEITKFLESRECKIPTVSCECCGSTENPETGEVKGPPGGRFNSTTYHITVCADNDYWKSNLLGIVQHEYIHANDKCAGFDFSKCHHLICSELRAYKFMNPDPGVGDKWTTKEYLRKRVKNSVAVNPDCLVGYDEAFDEAWEKCSPNASGPIFDSGTIPN